MLDTLAFVAAAGGLQQIVAQIITTIITFVAVLVVLRMFAWGPVLEVIDARKREVTDRFEEIDSKLAKANALQKEYEQKLAKINEEAREIQNKAMAEGERIAEERKTEGQAEAARIIEKAKSDMEIEMDKARLVLRREVAEMTLHATGKLLNVELNDDRHREMVDVFISDLANKEKIS